MSLLQFFKGYKNFAIGFAILSIIILLAFYYALNQKQPLLIYNPAQFQSQLVDSSIQHVSKYHTIADFELTNQNGETITQTNYKDKIYVADFFFTTCPTICPVMTKNMGTLQDYFLDDNEVMLLSHSVTPKIDSVPQLKKYALEKGVNDQKWNLVTGSKKHIYELARKSYFAVQTNGNGDEYDMIHTENFILIDKKRRIRGTYDGTKPEEIERLIDDIENLKSFGGY